MKPRVFEGRPRGVGSGRGARVLGESKWYTVTKEVRGVLRNYVLRVGRLERGVEVSRGGVGGRKYREKEGRTY